MSKVVVSLDSVNIIEVALTKSKTTLGRRSDNDIGIALAVHIPGPSHTASKHCAFLVEFKLGRDNATYSKSKSVK